MLYRRPTKITDLVRIFYFLFTFFQKVEESLEKKHYYIWLQNLFAQSLISNSFVHSKALLSPLQALGKLARSIAYVILVS